MYMLLWVLLFLACVGCASLFSLFTTFAPGVAQKVHVTDPPELVTYPPAPRVNAFPLQSRDTDQPIPFLYSGSQATRR